MVQFGAVNFPQNYIYCPVYLQHKGIQLEWGLLVYQVLRQPHLAFRDRDVHRRPG